jgi:parallel beta-helix repeat protein
MTLKADPATDDLQATFVTSLGALTTSYWNGSAWTILPSVIDALIDTSATRAADFEWDPSGSTGRVVWDDDGAGTTLTERPCAPECNGTTTTISTYNGAGAWIAMYRNPTAVDTVNILASRLNSDFDIGSFTWNGTGYTNYGDSAITANTTVITFEASTMSFQLSNASVNVHSCSLIDGNGEYVLTANLIGAPVSASPLSGSTCIKIASSNVTFDCNGFNITNNGTAGATYGILLNGSLTNVTVKNCPAISNYTYGIYANHTDNSLFTNNTLHSNSGGGGFVLVGGANNTINNSTAYNNSGSGGFVKNFGTGGNNSFINNNAYNNTQGFRTILADIDYINNTAYNNSQHGFDIGNVDFILLDNNTAYNNSQYGFNLVGSNNNATNNTAYNNTIYGFYVEGAHNRLIKNLAYRNLDNGIFVSAFVESNNTLYNNTAHSNTGDGFEVNLDDSNNLTLNVAYNNSLYGFNLNDTDNNTLEDNTAYNNSLDGFLFTSSSNNTLTNNTAYNNSKSGFLLKSNSNNTLTRNKAETNTQHGFLLNVSSGNTIISSNGTRNTLDGIRLLASNNNTIDPSFFCNNTGNGITVNNSNNTLIDDSVACNNTANGIEIINSTNTTINRSQIYNNSQGIFMTNSDSNNFTNSNVTNNTNNGIRFDSASTGSNLTTCRICNNALDINNLGTTNNGTADRCDSFVSWTENGHPGCTFTCSSFWHRFFGNVNGTLILGHNQSAPYVYSWNATGFNIYFTDADAVINFHQLQAIGRNTTNQTSTNDFTELDTAFNGTGFSDNINRTYSTDGSSPIETDNYTVFLRPINFVPVANSTAFNTSFNTGILWDMADGGTEYSNSFNQSTVWVVKINVSSADVYGTYDYLIQVPYTLATYEGNTSLVDIYLELK